MKLEPMKISIPWKPMIFTFIALFLLGSMNLVVWLYFNNLTYYIFPILGIFKVITCVLGVRAVQIDLAAQRKARRWSKQIIRVVDPWS